MDLFQVIEKRRSVRKFSPTVQVPAEVIQTALEMATLAPNSSNTQTWDFYWIRSDEMRKKMAYACLSQSAATSASDIVIVAADPKKWRRSWKRLIDFHESVDAPPAVRGYYKNVVPHVYRPRLGNIHLPLRRLAFFVAGLFRPVPRRPLNRRDREEMVIKSAALAAENFVLAVTAQGFASCMMEGFDERRVKALLNLPCSARIVMAIAVGEELSDGHWGPRFRLPAREVVHRL